MAENKKSSINNKSTVHLLNIKQPERVANRLKFTFQRTSAVVSLLKMDKNVEASISMVDISDAGAGVFTSELLLKGSTVELCLTEPRILKVKCLVAWSIPVQSGINNKRYPFRSGLQFVFQNEMQRSAVIEFIQKINTDPLENLKSHAMEPSPPVSNADPQPNGAPAPAADASAVPPGTEGQTPPVTEGAVPAPGSPESAATPAAAPAGDPVVEAPAATATDAAVAPSDAPAAAPADATTPPPAGDGSGGSQAA